MAERDIAVRLSLLEQDMKRANNALSKIEENSEKHREQHSQITEKIYDRMEEVRAEFKNDIADLKESFEEKIAAQNEILNQINSKLNDLDKWRWLVIGGAAVIGFIISKIVGVFSINVN